MESRESVGLGEPYGHVACVKSEGNHPLAMLRSHVLYGFSVCSYDFWVKGVHEPISLPYRFCKVHIPVQYKIVWMIAVRLVVRGHTGHVMGP